MTFFVSWGLAGAEGCGGGCRAGDGAGFKCVFLFLLIKMQIKILNSIKTKSTLSWCIKSLRCVAGIYPDI